MHKTDIIRRHSYIMSQRAHEVIRQCNINGAWTTVGAECRLVGSLRMGLLCKHRDIDFHVYSSGITTETSFKAMSILAKNPNITEIKCINGLHTDEHCIQWQAIYRDIHDDTWQIDMIHIESGSRYDGFFEAMADKIAGLLTDDTRDTILRLKYETPENEEIHGVEYYQAVIEYGINDLDNLRDWVRKHRKEQGAGQYWMP